MSHILIQAEVVESGEGYYRVKLMDGYGRAEMMVAKEAALPGQSDPVVAQALGEVQTELQAAVDQHGHFRSAHEGWAVILEELDELWDIVRLKKSKRSPEAMRQEAKQVAAMAVKFMMDAEKFGEG